MNKSRSIQSLENFIKQVECVFDSSGRVESEADSGHMSSPSPAKSRGVSSGSNGDERPRFFDTKAKHACWMKADVVAGRHPDRWRKDAAGNVVCGESVAENCQILQTRVNRYKSDKTQVDGSELKGYSCDVQFTDKELDIIEMAVYGDVIRPGNQCRCKTVAEMLGKYKSKDGLAPCKLP
uniref:Uncharacterized protein n=1 Tax=Kalanchoe fedtschenkoi TaxID=63787 RepID=A0A7N0TZS7_KALFE